MRFAQDDDRRSEVLVGFWHVVGVFAHEAERQRFGCDLLGRHAVQTHHDVFGVSALQFLADPIGGTVTPVSERINVTAGDEVHLQIRG